MQTRTSILALIPGAERILAGEVDDPPYERVAISVFDCWLGPDRLDELDCRDEAERAERNGRLLALWARIYDETEVWWLNERGRLSRVPNRDLFMDRCQYDPERPGDQFTFVVLPDLDVLYKEDWDDTNVAWFMSEERMTPMRRWAKDCGLHVLQFAE